MREFIVTAKEWRGYRVEYIVRAEDATAARKEVEEGNPSNIVDESAQMDEIVNQDILSVKENV
jgi:hypothetical protein